MKRNLYFFVIDDVSFSSVTEIVWTSKDRSISIPTISKESKVYGVLYAAKETATAMKENRFKIAHMGGLKALKMMTGGCSSCPRRKESCDDGIF